MATLPKRTPLWLRRAAFAAGFVAAATLVVLGRFAPARTPLGLDVTVTTSPTGELAVAPIGKVVDAGALAPGRGAAHGSITLSNQTSAELHVRLRAAPSIA